MSEESRRSKDLLIGLFGRVTSPPKLGVVFSLVAALCYGFVAIDFPEGTLGWFSGIAVVVSALVSLLTLRFEGRALSSLKLLSARDAGAPTRAALLGAVRETMSFPDREFLIYLWHWAGAAVLLALLFRTVPGVSDWSASGRILTTGLVLAPLTGTLAYLLTLRRSREAVRRLVAGRLTPKEVVAAAPHATLQFKRRLVTMSAVLVFTPGVLIADMTHQQMDRSVTKVLATTDRNVQRAVVESERTVVLVSTSALTGLIILFALGAASVGGRALGEPMKEIADQAARIADGDLSRFEIVPAEDELWAVGAAFQSLHVQLNEAIGSMRGAGLRISESTRQMLMASEKQEAGTTEQALSLTMTTATTEELARSARQIAASANEVATLASETVRAAEDGKLAADDYYSAMVRMRKDNQVIADAVVKLNKRVQQIGKIAEFINGIADKSDLLALNAELEGTKAGEVGRGFSLVAAEMRRLAESVTNSTRQIAQLIEEIRDATNAAVMATEAGVKATDSNGVLAQQVSETLGAVLLLANQTSEAVRAISLATQQQQTATDQLVGAMGEILSATQTGATASREAATATASLSSLSADLKEVVERFKVS